MSVVDRFLCLPVEILVTISEYDNIDHTSLFNMTTVCKKIEKSVLCNEFWRVMFIKNFGNIVKQSYPVIWRVVYSSYLKVENNLMWPYCFEDLIEAIENDDFITLNFLLSKGFFDVSGRSNKLLSLAVKLGRDEMVKRLLEEETIYEINDSLLRIAILNNHEKIARLLLNDDRIVFHYILFDYLETAVYRKMFDIVDILLDIPDSKINKVNPLLMSCIIPTRWLILIELLENNKHKLFQKALKNPQPKEDGDSLLTVAARFSNVNVVREVLKLNIDLSAEENNALKFATTENKVDVLNVLLEHSSISKVSDKLNTALLIASSHGFTQIVKRFLALPQVDPNFRNNCCIFRAVKKGHADIVDLLLSDPRIKLEQVKNSLLLKASIKGNLRIIKRIWDGCSYRNNLGKEFTIATRKGYIDVVKFFFQTGKIRLSLIPYACIGALKFGHFNVYKFIIKKCLYENYFKDELERFIHKNLRYRGNKKGEVYLFEKQNEITEKYKNILKQKNPEKEISIWTMR